MNTLKAVYKNLNTRKSFNELCEDLERVNVRKENGTNFDVILHYSDGSIRWIAFNA